MKQKKQIKEKYITDIAYYKNGNIRIIGTKYRKYYYDKEGFLIRLEIIKS